MVLTLLVLAVVVGLSVGTVVRDVLRGRDPHGGPGLAAWGGGILVGAGILLVGAGGLPTVVGFGVLSSLGALGAVGAGAAGSAWLRWRTREEHVDDFVASLPSPEGGPLERRMALLDRLDELEARQKAAGGRRPRTWAWILAGLGTTQMVVALTFAGDPVAFLVASGLLTFPVQRALEQAFRKGELDRVEVILDRLPSPGRARTIAGPASGEEVPSGATDRAGVREGEGAAGGT